MTDLPTDSDIRFLLQNKGLKRDDQQEMAQRVHSSKAEMARKRVERFAAQRRAETAQDERNAR